MNKFILVLAAFFCTNQISAQYSVLDKFFENHQDDTAFTVVNVSPKMFEMISRIDPQIDEEGAEEIKEAIKGITGLRILVRDDQDGRALFDQAFGKISKDGFEELLTVRDKGENVRFMVKEGDNSDFIKQLVLLVGGDDNFVLMDLTGNISLKSVGKLGKAVNLPGSEHLEKIDEH